MNSAKVQLAEAVLEAVREASRQGRPVSSGEVFAALAGQGQADLHQKNPAEVEAILASHDELASFAGLNGDPVYRDPSLLSGAYARIQDRKASSVALMAEEIRLNARDYRRPVPVELFEAPPFDLKPDDIRQTLQAMAASPAYEDITFTTTLSGAVYLFSTQGLERKHAEFLAEHAENLAANP